jgi:hypothetical protein
LTFIIHRVGYSKASLNTGNDEEQEQANQIPSCEFIFFVLFQGLGDEKRNADYFLLSMLFNRSGLVGVNFGMCRPG